MREKLYVNAEQVIINLLKAEERAFVDMSEIFQFCEYIERQLREQEYIAKIQSVYFDITFDSIERTVKYNNYIFDLIGNQIFLKQSITLEIQNQFSSQPLLIDLINKFVKNKVSTAI